MMAAHLPAWVRHLGLVGWLGLAMLAASAWVVASWLPAQQALIDQQGSEARRLRHTLEQKLANGNDSQAAARITSPQAALQVLWEGMPDARQRVARQSEVLASAVRGGLRISAVQYRGQAETWSAREGQVIWRQQMDMPVDGSYAALRAWLDRLLADPALAIDVLDIQREDPGLDQVRARVGLSLYWRQAQGQGVTP